MTDGSKKLLITGGGSGGHISAATAILEGIRQTGKIPPENILYVGSNVAMEGEKSGKSLEQRIVGESDVPFIAIRAGKLQRYFSWNSLKLFFGVFGGVIDAWKVISGFKPDIIISTGGYVTVPITFVGWLKRIPIYLHEQTAAVGLTNKISSKFATKIFTSFKQSDSYFPKGKTLHVGNAVRPQIFDTNGSGEVVDAVKLMQQDKDNLPIVLIAGGGQGSHLLNLITRQMLRYSTGEFQIILQTGDNQVHRDYDIMLKEKLKLPKEIQHRFYPTKFINADEIGYLFKHMDYYIGRSGANFTYEMGVMKKPSIFIPIPWVTHNEQEKNAQTMVDVGLGVILKEGELTAERLYNEIRKLHTKAVNGNIKAESQQIEDLFPTNAVDKIIEYLNF